MAREYKCRTCGAGPFAAAGAVAGHNREMRNQGDAAHAKAPKAHRGDKGRSRNHNALAGSITETELIATCSSKFDDADLDDPGRRRVIDYLYARYYPETEEAA